MKPSTLLEKNREQIKQIILEHNVLNPRVFGSVLNGTDTELVTWTYSLIQRQPHRFLT